METVKRLAASVRPRSSNHDSSPALVRSGNSSVETRAKQTSNEPIAEIAISSALLFQVLLSVISRKPPLGRIDKPGREPPRLWNQVENYQITWNGLTGSASLVWPLANLV